MQPSVQSPPVRSFVKNIIEKPVLNQPNSTPGVTVVTSKKTTDKQNIKSYFSLKYLIGIVVLVLVVIGVIISFSLSQQNQDVRQQASTPTGVAELSVSPTTSTFPAGSSQTLTFKVNMNVADKQIAGIQFIADITGTLPDDLLFTPATISGLNPVSQNIIDITGGKQLTVGFLTSPPATFTTTTNNLTLGTLTFTAPSSGAMTITFDQTLSKIIAVEESSTEDILHTPSSETYTITSGGSNSPTPTITQQASQPTATPTATLPPGVTPTATPKPTATPTLPPGVTPSSTPIPTATPTTYVGNGGGTVTFTPTPYNDGSSQPADTQETPVSGSAEQTIFLLLAGIVLTVVGTFAWKRS